MRLLHNYINLNWLCTTSIGEKLLIKQGLFFLQACETVTSGGTKWPAQFAEAESSLESYAKEKKEVLLCL